MKKYGLILDKYILVKMDGKIIHKTNKKELQYILKK